MRHWAAALIALTAASCGYVGDPLPPAFYIPRPVDDLRAQQIGANLSVQFTVPLKTTEDLPVKDLSGAELRVGPSPQGVFNPETWAASAKSVPLTTPDAGPVSTTFPIASFAGQDVVIGVRLANAKGRLSGWSNLVSARIEKPLAAPSDIRADSAVEGVALTWSGTTGAVLVFRDDQQAGEAKGGKFIDTAVELGKSYRYHLQAKQGVALSEPSAEVTVTFADRFPPSVPTKITAVAGAGTVELAWERSPEADTAGYVISRSAGDGEFAIVTKVDAPAYSDRDVKGGMRYRYRIAAVDIRNNQSSLSPPVEITLP